VLGVRNLVSISGRRRDERIAAVAELQRGHITRAQLRAVGVPDSTITRLAATGRIVRVHPSVYAVRPIVPAPLARESAALLACGPNALLSHRSAAALWKLCEPSDGPVEVTIPLHRRRNLAGIQAHRSCHLLPQDVVVEQGLPVTSPARTVLDRAATLSARDLERELDEALVVQRIVRRRQLEDVLARSNGRNGAAVLRRLLAARTRETLTRSEAERMFLRLIRKAGLPEPETQVPIEGFTADFLWPEIGVVFEIDGYKFHTSRRAFDRDRRKDRVLKAAGFDPNRVSRDQVKHEPLSVVAHVAAAVSRAQRAVGAGR
jgi:very-short-patch-repair endonuclease